MTVTGVISRKDAKAAGLSHYFTGKPCCRGHYANRLVSIGKCVECNKVQMAGWRSKNKDRWKEISRASYGRHGIKHRRAFLARHPERAKDIDRRYRLRNIERIRARGRARVRNVDVKKAREAAKRWKLRNPERAKELRRLRRLARIEHFRAMDREYAKRNPLVTRAKNAARAARKKGAEGRYSADDVNALFKAQKGKCAYCKRKLKSFHVDHIVPLARGGNNWPSNLQICCPSCNSSKGARDPIDFARQMGFML